MFLAGNWEFIATADGLTVRQCSYQEDFITLKKGVVPYMYHPIFTIRSDGDEIYWKKV